MNGDVNGIMEESVESSLPASPLNEQAHQKVTVDNCDEVTNHCENSNNTESSNHVDSETNISSSDNGALDIALMKEDKELVSENEEDPLKNISEHECSMDEIQNHSENSKESYSEPIDSCQEKSETIEQTNLKELVELSENNDNDKPEYSVQNSNDEPDSDESSGDEESESRRQHKAEDTVSINSDSDEEDGDETSQESQAQQDNKDIIILDTDNRPGSQNGNSDSHEVHEIDSDNDDCVVATDEKEEEKPIDNEKAPLRRSSRAKKRIRYNDVAENGGESDIEEIGFQDPLSRRSKPIVINDTKALVEMAAKQMKHGYSQKKEPTVVIIDTNSVTPTKGTSLLKNKNSSSSTQSALSAQNLYQSIVARGTTVTPISSKNNNTSTQVSQNTQPAILPSLTDDMFVVEAPSFIVPYVYEKPSIKPFREFVLKLGQELEEQKLKDKEDEPESKVDEKKEMDEEDNDEASAEETKSTLSTEESQEEGTKKKKTDSKDRKRKNDEDDASWDGESASESDDALSDEEDKIVVKDKTEPIDQIKNVTELTADKICSTKTSASSSMDCSLGKFFINIGLNLVQEFVQTDLLKQQNRKLYKEKKLGQNTKATESSIVQLMKNLEFSKENNAPYAHPQKKCEFCSFKSASMLVMAHHLETPHMRNNVYKCNYCTFEIRSPHDILYHMEAEHNVRGKLERAPSYHQCANCPFEDNGKGKLARHLIACAKKFKPDTNLAPPVDWEPPAKIPKISKPRNNVMGHYQNTFNRGQMGSNINRTPVNIGNMMPGMSAGYRPRGRSPMTVPPRAPVHGIPIIRPGSMTRHNSPVLMQSNFPVANNVKPKSVHQPSISITPLPRQPQPQIQQTQGSQQSKSSFVICEICDGYIKDLEQLRNHMQWIHKVKIHPKMIYNRPPLNCQKCQFRFFTDQGLERHLLGSHGLVTSSMQEAANKGKDAGRCPVCGRVYQWKLLNHVARDHNLTLKPAHLSYKCTVCTATFGMYKQFENHVYSAHSVVAKRVMDKSKANAPPAKGADSRAKPLKINDEITIIPQQAKSTTSAASTQK